MSAFRTLLILLLCLSVPSAGWASVAGGLDPQHSAVGSSGALPHHDHAGAHHHAEQSSHSDHHHRALGMGSRCDRKSCHHRCACGCGMGACATAFAPLIARMPVGLLRISSDDAPASSRWFAVAAPRSSNLRPPIA